MKKKAEKRYAGSSTTDIKNLPGVFSWFDAHGDKRLGFDRTMAIMSDNRVELARLFGPRQQTYTSEFRFDVWRIELDGLFVWLLSAKGKGTCIEIEVPELWDRDDEKKIIEFLDTLYVDLKRFENEALKQAAEDY